jgi:hypothetical protein
MSAELKVFLTSAKFCQAAFRVMVYQESSDERLSAWFRANLSMTLKLCMFIRLAQP